MTPSYPNGMPPLTLSSHQLGALRALRDGPRTAEEIRVAAGIDILPGALPTVLRSLHQRSLIVYVGGRGVKAGRGQWRLTTHGISMLREFGELAPGGQGPAHG